MEEELIQEKTLVKQIDQVPKQLDIQLKIKPVIIEIGLYNILKNNKLAYIDKMSILNTENNCSFIINYERMNSINPDCIELKKIPQ